MKNGFFFCKAFLALPTQIAFTLDEANKGYSNSKVEITLRRFCIEQYTGPENTDCGVQLEQFRDHKNDNYQRDFVPNLRRTADIAVLLRTQMAQRCGGIAYVNRPGSTRLAVGVVDNTDTSQLVFNHEVSHMLGCEHDDDTNNNEPPRISYARGNLYGTAGRRGKHTIMAYYKTNYPNGVNYYSGPQVRDADVSRA